MSLLLFTHVLGCAMWIGGGLAGLMIEMGVKQESVEVRAGAFRLLARLHTLVIGFGALLVLGSGVVLTMSLDTEGLGDLMREPRLWVMIVAGLLAGFMVLFVGLPTASRMGALAVPSSKGELPPAFEMYRRRSAWITVISGTLAVIALLAWYVL
ncbi:MAG: hypothetical protein OER90_08190 [Gemmatimonadota bacterium]|nr:hypothetical protein [Gemmatimonadota bacterium]